MSGKAAPGIIIKVGGGIREIKRPIEKPAITKGEKK